MSGRRILRAELNSLDAAGATVVHRFANEGHIDALGNHVEARLKSAGVLRRDMFGQARLRGAQEIGVCAIVLNNMDGALDGLSAYSFDGQRVSVYELDSETLAVSTWPFEELYAEQPIFDESVITVSVRTVRHQLDMPILTTKYAGTNAGSPLAGVEGTANDLQGHPKPRVIGSVFNVTPNQVNTDKQIYQISSGTPLTLFALNAGFTLTVYDKRSPLTAGAAYVSQADMEANAPAAGTYRLWTQGGCFRVGGAVTRITCDCYNPLDSGGSLLSSGLRVLAQEAGIGPVASLTHPASFFDSLDPEYGIYLNEERTYLDVMTELLASGNAFVEWGTYPATTPAMLGTGGQTFFSSLFRPEAIPYTATLLPIELDDNSIVPGSFKPSVPADAERGLPVWRVIVRYARNYTVMSDSDLAGVAAADREFCKQEWRAVVSEDAAVKTQWPNATELIVDTAIKTSAYAAAAATMLRLRYAVKRQIWQLTVYGQVIREQPQFTAPGATVYPRMFQVGSVVHLTHSRFGLAAGKSFIVIGIQENFDADTMDLTLWG